MAFLPPFENTMLIPTLSVGIVAVPSAVSFAYAMWVLYLAIMNLKRAKDAGTISVTALCLGYPLLVVGLLLDVLGNLTLFSLITLDFPREFLMTTHMNRLIATDTGWRREISVWICHNLLDEFDPSGCHCKGE